MTHLADKIDASLKRFCQLFLWANFLLMFSVVIQVICRYFFNFTSAAFEELQWHFYSIAMLVGITYALITDSHVRADILYGRMSERKKSIIDLLSMLLFVLPFFTYLFWQSLPFVERSFAVGESSGNPGGLPFRWLIKGAIPVACLLVDIAAISKIMRSIDKLRGQHGA
ncbi:MAG: TRAP transporter small permease subunit [Lentisphaeraceae bacterium]|nr:TRAP transporter small permease subunit [Lentisphaeraceae bacterium]